MAKKKTANKPAKSFEESLWDAVTKLRGSDESSGYWSGSAETTRQGRPKDERGRAHQYKRFALSLIFHKDQNPDLKVDYIKANPPFNSSQRGTNYAWILHMVSKLSEQMKGCGNRTNVTPKLATITILTELQIACN